MKNKSKWLTGLVIGVVVLVLLIMMPQLVFLLILLSPLVLLVSLGAMFYLSRNSNNKKYLNLSRVLAGLSIIGSLLLVVVVAIPEGSLEVEDETSSVQKVDSSEKETEEESKKLAEAESIEEESKKESLEESIEDSSKKESVQELLVKEAKKEKEPKRKEEQESKRKADEESKKESEALIAESEEKIKEEVPEEPKEYKREDYNPETTYDDLARYPDVYFFVPVTFEGKIIQVIHGDDSTQYRMAANGDYDQIFFLEIPNSSLDKRVLEDDYVRFYGNFMGDIKYETVLGSSRTIPGVMVDNFEFQ